VLRSRLREVAEHRRRFGCARVHAMLKREGLIVNHKKAERIYRGESLSLRLEKRKKKVAMIRVKLSEPQHADQRWSMDSISDSTCTGRRFRAPIIVGDFSRECPAIEVDTSLGGARVVNVLQRLVETRGLPEVITTDNGPEFTGRAVDEWAYRKGVKLNFIRPGKPVKNAYAKSFIGRLHGECLHKNWFITLKDARETIEAWRVDYNGNRPHSLLKYLSPMGCAKNDQITLIHSFLIKWDRINGTPNGKTKTPYERFREKISPCV
jgi:putative transposase